MSFQQKCYERLQEFRRAGVAIAFVSHNMQAISMLSDRVAYLQPGRPPKIGSVGDMVTAYVTTDSSSADARVSVVKGELRQSTEFQPLMKPVPPGTWLTLDLEIRASTDLPNAGLALLFHRADGLLVFNGNSLADGAPPFDLLNGQTWKVSVRFRTNLLRGTYAISGLLLEKTRHWPAVELGVLGSFVVVETTRAAGVADLEPEYLTHHEVAVEK
jgi:hypothetical protein